MKIDTILTIAMSSIYVILTLILYITNWVKSIKTQNLEKQKAFISITQEEITNTALDLIEKAETFKNYNATEKLNYVITRLKDLNQNLYDENGLIALVNRLVKTTKNVNVGGKKQNGNST